MMRIGKRLSTELYTDKNQSQINKNFLKKLQQTKSLLIEGLVFSFLVFYLFAGDFEDEGQSKGEEHAGCVEHKRTKADVAVWKAERGRDQNWEEE